MKRSNLKKFFLSTGGIFVLLVLFIIGLFSFFEWYTASGRNGKFAVGDNYNGKAAVEHFKEGEKLFRKGDEYQAMEEFLEAERYCNNIKNELLKGAINWYKGDLYYNRLDFTNALTMYNLSKDSYQQCGHKDEVMELFGKIAEVQLKIKNYEEAILNYGKARSMAMEMAENQLALIRKGRTDSTLFKKYETAYMNYSTSLLGGYFSKESMSDETLSNLNELYSKYNDGKESPEDYLLLAYIYSYSAKTDLANKYINEYIAWRYSPKSQKGALSGIEKAGIYLLQSDIAKTDLNFKGALDYREKYDAIIDSINTVERTQSIREIENSYWQKELTRQNDQVRQRAKYLIIIYVLGVLLAVVVIFVIIAEYKRRLSRKNAEIETYMQNLKDLDDELSSAKAGNAVILEQLDVHKEKENHLKELLEGRFAEVRELVRTYYESGNSKKLQKKVEDLLKLQLSGDNFEVMEEVVNAKNDNIISRVREKYPQLKEDNIKLLNLVYAGFSAQEISVILNDTPQNIYVRKSRLKKLITELSDVDI